MMPNMADLKVAIAEGNVELGITGDGDVGEGVAEAAPDDGIPHLLTREHYIHIM
jgi:hypothetical protein